MGKKSNHDRVKNMVPVPMSSPGNSSLNPKERWPCFHLRPSGAQGPSFIALVLERYMGHTELESEGNRAVRLLLCSGDGPATSFSSPQMSSVDMGSSLQEKLPMASCICLLVVFIYLLGHASLSLVE